MDQAWEALRLSLPKPKRLESCFLEYRPWVRGTYVYRFHVGWKTEADSPRWAWVDAYGSSALEALTSARDKMKTHPHRRAG